MANRVLFIYGSLKRGLPAHQLLAGARFLGEAVTTPAYRLYDLGPFPGLVPVPEDGVSVHGELWEVDGPTLARLDEYEGVPSLYRREPVDLAGDAPVVGAEAYVYQKTTDRVLGWGNRWPSDDHNPSTSFME